jgi:hypothetical protein
LEAVQVGATAAVPDVTVKPDEVLRHLLHPPRDRLPVDVMQRPGLASQVRWCTVSLLG